MIINQDLLFSMGATEVHFDPGDYIFLEDDTPEFYYQIIEGYIKLTNHGNEGKELIQNIFKDGSCFGEAMLILEKVYPVNAIAVTECKIVKICREKFMLLLNQHPDITIQFCTALSDTIYNKFVSMRKMSGKNAVDRLTEMMDLLKESQDNQEKYSYQIPHTRRQLASLTGLCIDTTIRALKKMEENKMLKIKNRKIYY